MGEFNKDLSQSILKSDEEASLSAESKMRGQEMVHEQMRKVHLADGLQEGERQEMLAFIATFSETLLDSSDAPRDVVLVPSYAQSQYAQSQARSTSSQLLSNFGRRESMDNLARRDVQCGAWADSIEGEDAMWEDTRPPTLANLGSEGL